MPILVSMTYSIVTPESAEDGDDAENGFEWENSPHTFRELVALMRDHPEPSCWPLRHADTGVWFTSQADHGSRSYFEQGEEKTTSIHYSRQNAARAEKYWHKAARAAGLTK